MNRREIIKPLFGAAIMSALGNNAIAKEKIKYSIIKGEGSPSIIMIHGLDADIDKSFAKIIDPLAIKYKVAAFNRKGYGGVKYNNEPKSGQFIAQELRQNLLANNIKPPFLLIGHSLGAVYADFFARLYNDETMGVLFIDPMAQGQEEFLEKYYPDAYAALNMIFLFAKKPIKAEFAASRKLHDELKNLPDFKAKNIFLLANQIAGLENPQAYINYRIKTLSQLAQNYNGGVKIVNCGHFIQNEMPNAIIEAINYLTNK